MLNLVATPSVREEDAENTMAATLVLTNVEGCLVSDFNGTEWFSAEPCMFDGQAVRFNPALMEEGAPYPFQMSGSWFVAVKRAEGHIDFFFVEL
jgi:hypothetical protein